MIKQKPIVMEPIVEKENTLPNANNWQKRSPTKIKHFSYEKNRKCLHCEKPIPDHKSLKRVYCEIERDENDKILKDCRGAYNRQKDKPEQVVHRAIINEQKSVDERIAMMIAKKGDIVSTADLDAYDIRLDSPLKYKLYNNGTLESHFLKYTITSNPINQTHKIIKHE